MTVLNSRGILVNKIHKTKSQPNWGLTFYIFYPSYLKNMKLPWVTKHYCCCLSE